MTKLISRNTVTWFARNQTQRDPKKDVIQQEMKLWKSRKILSKKNQLQKFRGCRVGCYSWWSEGNLWTEHGFLTQMSPVWNRSKLDRYQWSEMQQVFDSSKTDIPSWMVRSTISHLGYYFFVFWFWYELSQRQNNLWSTVNLLGDSYEEVANLLDVPGQSAGSEHPGLWRCQEAFYKSFDFYKNHFRMKWTWKCLTFPPIENYVNYKKPPPNHIMMFFVKELVPHWGLGPMICRLCVTSRWATDDQG